MFSWNPPAAANGALEGYELCITTQLGAVAAQQSNACALTMKTAVSIIFFNVCVHASSVPDLLVLSPSYFSTRVGQSNISIHGRKPSKY